MQHCPTRPTRKARTRGDRLHDALGSFEPSVNQHQPNSRPAIVQPTHPAPLWKRLAAALYDLLPLAALMMVGTALLLPLTGGAAMPQLGLTHFAYQLFVFALIAGYYIWSWHRGGQTIGMRAWRLRVQTQAGSNPDVRTASLRFVFSLVSVFTLGLGLIWALFDNRRRMWHDRWTGTEVIVVPKSQE